MDNSNYTRRCNKRLADGLGAGLASGLVGSLMGGPITFVPAIAAFVGMAIVQNALDDDETPPSPGGG